MLEHVMKVTNREYAQKSGQVDNARKMHNWMKNYQVEWKEDVLGDPPDARRQLSFLELMALKPSARSHHIDGITLSNKFCREYFREINDFYARNKIVRFCTYTFS